MGYSSGPSYAVMRALSRRGDISSYDSRYWAEVSLDAHVDPCTGGSRNSRTGILKVVSGGLSLSNEYTPAVEYGTFQTSTDGGSFAYSNVSVNSGDLVGGFPADIVRVYHIYVTTQAWLMFGDNTITVAVDAGYPMMPYTVYPFTASNGYDCFAVIRDSADGKAYYGRAFAGNSSWS